jgi:hypothetical protein
MRKLASNDKAALFKCGSEYWCVDVKFNIGCYNSQSPEYNALNALQSFEKEYGAATWKHERIAFW